MYHFTLLTSLLSLPEGFACLAGGGTDSIPWFGPDRVNRSVPLQEQIYSCSVNLLASELLFERQESQTLSTFESSTLAFLVPNLVGFSAVLSEMEEDNPEVVRFSCRCCWLAALYYNKLSRVSSDDATAAEAEQFSLECLDHAESLLKNHSLVISAKHLSVGEISRDNIIKRRSYITATSVVSKARESFSALAKSVVGRQDGGFHLEDDEKKTLANIGHALLERYVTLEGSTGIIDELLDDFLALNDTAVPSNKEESLASMSRSSASRRSILQVIVTSLYAADKSTAPLIGLYTHLLERLAARLKSSDSSSVATRVAAVVFMFDKLAKTLSSEPDSMDFLDDNAGVIAGVIYTLPGERDVLEAVSTLLSSLRKKNGPSNEALDTLGKDGRSVHTIECSFFSKMVVDFINLRRKIGEHLDSSRRKDRRSKQWQQELLTLADSISTLAAELSEILSLYPCTVSANASVKTSHLVKALESVDYGHAPMSQLIEAALFIWEMQSVGNSLSLARSRLLVPVGSLLLSLSYPLRSKSITHDDDDFFDSDSSSQGAFLSAREGEQRTLLRRTAQVAQAAALVFKSLQGQEISKRSGDPSLVCVRVLSSLADSLFALFNSSVESDEWPFGARGIGSKIDDTLGRAYQRGFSLDSSETDSTRTYRPLSIKDARQLFFFLKRFYKHKRGSPPSRAFEMVLSALPREEDNPTLLAITNYMFSTNKPDYSIPETSESNIPVWIFQQSGTVHNPSEDEELLSMQRLRRAVSHELAKGSINSLDTSEDDDERKSTASSERAFIKKALAILDDLSVDPCNQVGAGVDFELPSNSLTFECRNPQLPDGVDESV